MRVSNKPTNHGTHCNQFYKNPTRASSSDGNTKYMHSISSFQRQLQSQKRTAPVASIGKSARFTKKEEEYTMTNFTPQPYSSIGMQTRASFQSAAAPSFGVRT